MTESKTPATKKKDAVAKAEPVAKTAPKKAAAPAKKTEPKAEVSFNASRPKPAPKKVEYRTDLLDNWSSLNSAVMDMSEEECLALIEHERKNKCRPNVIMRIHGRYNKLRGQREKSEMIQRLP